MVGRIQFFQFSKGEKYEQKYSTNKLLLSLTLLMIMAMVLSACGRQLHQRQMPQLQNPQLPPSLLPEDQRWNLLRS